MTILPLPRGTAKPETCIVNGCDTAPKARGLCTAHYARWLRQRPPGGYALTGALKCAVCHNPLRDHSVLRPCA